MRLWGPGKPLNRAWAFSRLLPAMSFRRTVASPLGTHQALSVSGWDAPTTWAHPARFLDDDLFVEPHMSTCNSEPAGGRPWTLTPQGHPGWKSPKSHMFRLQQQRELSNACGMSLKTSYRLPCLIFVSTLKGKDNLLCLANETGKAQTG